MNNDNDKKMENPVEDPKPVAEGMPVAEKAPTEKEVREGILRNLSKGVIELEMPIKAGDAEIKELHYDFNKIRGQDYIDAMDSDIKAQNAFKISNKQAFELFLKSAGALNKGVDEKDLRDRMSTPDIIAAVRISLIFFVTKSRGVDERIKSV